MRLRADLCVLDSNGSETSGKLIARFSMAKFIIADTRGNTALNDLVDWCWQTSPDQHRVLQSLELIHHWIGSTKEDAKLAYEPKLTPVLPTSPTPESRNAARFICNRGLEEKQFLIGLAVGSNSGLAAIKRWPINRYVQLVRALVSEYSNLGILLFKGPNENDIDFAELEQLGCVLVESLSLLESAAVVQRCHLFIGNDSGLAHISNSLGIPTITVFGPTDPSLIAPFGPNAVCIRDSDCPPCFGKNDLADCGGKRHCFDKIQPRLVMRVAREFLAKGYVPQTQAK